MAYIEQTDLAGKIPPSILLKAVDDNGDGVEDAGIWTAIATSVDETIDGYLEMRFFLPLPAVPKFIKDTARILACEACYDRVGFSGEKNPWSERAKAALAVLERIAKGELNLGSELEETSSEGGIVSEPSKVYRTDGRMMA
jgi:phage gp36-like protein